MDASKLADPAHATVLQKAEGKTRRQISQETGINPERTAEILENLENEDLVEPQIKEGRRIYRTGSTEEKLEEVKDQLMGKLIGGTRKAVREENFKEAKNHITQGSSVEDSEVQKTLTELEAAYRLKNL